jgi:hypothetical protein
VNQNIATIIPMPAMAPAGASSTSSVIANLPDARSWTES